MNKILVDDEWARAYCGPAWDPGMSDKLIQQMFIAYLIA